MRLGRPLLRVGSPSGGKPRKEIDLALLSQCPFLVHYPIFKKFCMRTQSSPTRLHPRDCAWRFVNFNDHREGPAFRNLIFFEDDFHRLATPALACQAAADDGWPAPRAIR
jgi:hypothetical protein